MSFMLLKVRSTVAVVTGSTIKMAANLVRLGKEVAIVVLLSRADSTCCKGASCGADALVGERVSILILCLLGGGGGGGG